MTGKARVIAALRSAGGPVTTPEVARAAGLSRGAAWSELLRLESVGVACRHRPTAGKPRRWGFARRASYQTAAGRLN